MPRLPVCRTALAAAAALAALPATAPAAERLFTVTPTNRLLAFQSDKPQAVLSQVRIAGLEQDERVLALDVRPATTALFGVTSRGRIAAINPETGQARPLTPDPFTPPLGSDAPGFDFNPTVDLLRVVTPEDLNLRVSPQTGRTTATDGTIRYAAGDPNEGRNPFLSAVAYTLPFPGGGTTRLYGIDAANSTLVVQDPANAGTLKTVAPLTVAARRGAGASEPRPVGRITGPVSFDISESGRAFVSFRLGGASTPAATLFTLNVQSGVLRPADFIGPQFGRTLAQGTRTQGLAAAGSVPDDDRAPDVVFAAPQDQRLRNVLTRGLRFEVSCSEACAIGGVATIGRRVLGRGTAVADRAGKGNLRFRFSAAARRAILSSPRRRIVVRLAVEDFAGNVRTQSENVTLR